ncbi:MAG: GntP family permease [Bacteroidota bacterium]|nr:GntP family permease [Bacteroidota bacterium]MDP4257284.1 GntP family permease [Bacteroidota bacterium]
MILLWLALGIAVIILLTAAFRVHAFFALLIAAFIVGLGMHMPVSIVVGVVKQGFGDIMSSLGLIIILGATLGVLLEHTGSTRVLAGFILRRTGERRAPLAMSLTGLLVGLPIFCDSGYIVLSGLNTSLARRTGIPMIIMSVSLASGLYAVHCLIPPHPGAAGAAGTMGVDFGQLILAGIPVAILAMAAGYVWANYAGKKFMGPPPRAPLSATSPAPTSPSPAEPQPAQPTVLLASLPIIVPILLIAVRSFLVMDKAADTGIVHSLSFLGDPVIALAVGVAMALLAGRSWNRDSMSGLLMEAVEKAGGILVIIGAGGGFGAVLAATHPGQQFEKLLAAGHPGLLFPFLLTFLLKTAQGSSTVAIITAASIIHPLVPALGLSGPHANLFCVLAMGAGSMMISHANDAYFWVITRFSGLDMRSMLKVYSVATLLMGLMAMTATYLLYWLFP